jgi:hypothetical protein
MLGWSLLGSSQVRCLTRLPCLPTSPSPHLSPYVISDWERTTYYHGISPNHPDLLYRSDLLEKPFPIPKGRHPHLPTKTVYGVFNTPLNAVWDTVAPQIRQLLKTRKIRYSAIKTARLVTHGEDGKDTIGPVVIWISTHPTTTTAENAHDASLDVRAPLKANGVESAVVEWYEGAVEKLSGPHLLRVTDDTNFTHYVRRFLTAALGMPIATEATGAQGSVALFHENKDKRGTPSAKVFGVSNCHVLHEDTTVDYEFKGADTPRQQCRRLSALQSQRSFSVYDPFAFSAFGYLLVGFWCSDILLLMFEHMFERPGAVILST